MFQDRRFPDAHLIVTEDDEWSPDLELFAEVMAVNALSFDKTPEPGE